VRDGPDDDDYKVGYGRPPRKMQFKRGQSGNPKGRPKKIPDLSELIGEELESTRYVEIDNKRVKLTVKRLLVKQFIRLAIKGHAKALFPALEAADKHQKAAAKREAQKTHRRPTREEISKMTDQERTDLYMQTLKKVNGEE
jgi:DNA phosphorothioation-dependent restriction protein DptG